MTAKLHVLESLARSTGNSVIQWAADEIARLTAERDAARAESDRLRAAGDAMAEALTWDQSCAYDAATTRGAIRQRIAAWSEARACVAELERDRRPATWQEEEAAVEGAWLLCGLEPDWPSDEPGTIVRHAESMRREVGRLRARVAELEGAAAPAANAGGEPQPPRGWLTKEDCEALYLANAVLHGVFVGSWREKHDAAKRLEAIRVRALSEASGEAAAPPRGWLTAEEREAVDAARDYFDDDCVFIVYTAERDAAIRERDAARAESERLRAAGDAMAESLTWDQSCAYDAATTRGAIRQRIKAWNEASARVAELEGAAAANASGEQQEPVAWMYRGEAWFDGKIWHDRYETTKDEKVAKWKDMNAIPLYAAPLPPRGWLTAEEREAVDAAADAIGDRIDAYKEQDGDRRRIEVLDALLARETPPRVRRPKRGYPPVPGGVVHLRDTEWIAAIRAAGGEVEE